MDELNWNPPKVSRAARILDTEWEKYRVWICDLHQNGRTLEEIMTSVRSRCAEEGSSFKPSRRQYISQLGKWNLHRKRVTDDGLTVKKNYQRVTNVRTGAIGYQSTNDSEEMHRQTSETVLGKEHPDTLNRQELELRETTPGDIANDGISSKKWLMRSDIVEFLRLEYPSGEDLGKIMVIYGDERDACCMDCERFLARFAEPDLVSAVLNILGLAISSADQEQKCSIQLDESRWIDFFTQPVRTALPERNDLLVSAKDKFLVALLHSRKASV